MFHLQAEKLLNSDVPHTSTLRLLMTDLCGYFRMDPPACPMNELRMHGSVHNVAFLGPFWLVHTRFGILLFRCPSQAGKIQPMEWP